MKFIAILISLFMLSACDKKLEYEDASHLSELSHLVGQRYNFIQPMYLSGVNVPPGYGEEVDIYTIGPLKPSWSGPELISRKTLNEGQEFTIESFVKCTNCWEKSGYTDAYISLPNVPVEKHKKIMVPIKYLTIVYVSETQ